MYPIGTEINDYSIMKRILIMLLASPFTTPLATGQQPATLQNLPAHTLAQQNANSQEQTLVKFDMDFPGGTPRRLVEAIEKASGRSLNAIIPDEHADLKLPPLKMKSVTVPELFNALFDSSMRQVHQVVGGNMMTTTYNTSYGFRTGGRPTDNSIWNFYYEKPMSIEQPKACRFYQLAPYLENYKVDDITTAIQTGWKMLGETNPPTISFHKDTKLLIAVGEEAKLRLIDSVLSQLSGGKPAAQRESTAAKSTTAKP